VVGRTNPDCLRAGQHFGNHHEVSHIRSSLSRLQDERINNDMSSLYSTRFAPASNAHAYAVY